MKIGDIFRLTNNALRESDFIKASIVETPEQAEKYSKEVGKQIIPYTEIVKICEKFEVDPNNIFFTNADKTMDAYHYYHFPVIIDIPIFEEKAFEYLRIKERVVGAETHFNKLIRDKNYPELLSLVDSKIQFIVLEKIFDEIPEEKKYAYFIDTYTRQEYGFNTFPKEIIKEAFDKQSVAYRKDMLSRLNQVCSDEELVIYRGIAQQSTSPSEAYSWTLSFKVATFFAKRFDEMQGEIYTAKIKKDQVVDYITSRGEEEILVQPEDLYDVTPMRMINANDELSRLENNFMLYKFHNYLNTFEKDLFFDPEGIHGYLHMKRVLLHVISLASELGLEEYEINVLCLAALYHDIGRIDDTKDDYHGIRSWRKLEDKGMLEFIEEELELYDDEYKLLRFIIENHCLNDALVWDNLASAELCGYPYNEAKKLVEIFKDADGLDRVRLGDLDPKYLRTEEAKRRVLFAEQVLKGIR